MQGLKLTRRGQIVLAFLFSILLIVAILLAVAFLNWVAPDEKVDSNQIHITCVIGAEKLDDGTCKEIIG